MKVLVIGSGGREHAYVWKIAQSPLVKKIFCAPGNAGMTSLATCVPIDAEDVDALLAFALKKRIDLTVVGPEGPLSLGVVDRFEAEGLKVFGASQRAAEIESSKSFAKAVMEKSPYVYMYGKGAEALANKCQLEMVAQSYYDDEIRHAQLLKILETGGLARDHDISIQYPKGTVGAVALDSNGNLAAATSTGGLNGKASGRIGDTSVIGAGTYADNRTCCISCTGFGEQFIRIAAAYDIHARMLYKNLPLTQAAEEVVFGVLPPNTGGLVAVDKYGTVAMPYNTKGMFRGYAKGDGELQAYIWE